GRSARSARDCSVAGGCRAVARVSFRTGLPARVDFLECDPRPGLTPGWSDLVLSAKPAGHEYPALISEILSGAIRRYKERERERRETERGSVAAPPAANGGVAAPSPEEQKQEPQLRS